MTGSERMIERRLVLVAAVLGLIAVALGAFGAHALEQRLDAEALGWWQTGVQYQMWHALAVLALGLSGLAWARLPAWLLAAGALLFSATLYAMALGAPRGLGAVTPIGGLIMVAGWALLCFRAARMGRGRTSLPPVVEDPGSVSSGLTLRVDHDGREQRQKKGKSAR